MPSAARVRGPARASTCRCKVALFISEVHGLAPADALYVTFFGGNDLRDALQAPRVDPTGATSVGIIQAAIASYQTNLLTLHAAARGASSYPTCPTSG